MAYGYDVTVTGSDATLGYLQGLLLSAVLLGGRLPGARRPVQLPVGEHGLRELPSKIRRAHLAQSLKLDELPGRLEAVSLDQLKSDERALAGGEASFLAFRPALWRYDRVELSLVIGVMRREDGNWVIQEIGHIDAEFHEVDGRWESLNEPHVYLSSVG